jgi:hypothetical protein
MIKDLEQRIEEYLLEAPGDGWVDARQLCVNFDIDERRLRNKGNTQGLCSRFAISRSKGFKHVNRASAVEFKRFKHGMRKHAIAQLRRVRDLEHRRHQVTTAIDSPTIITEKDTGQILMFAQSTGVPIKQVV